MSSSFRIGFTGATLDAALPWIDAQVGDAETVVVTMAGSGKDIAHLARKGRTIYSWDPQFLSHCVVNGVFAAKGDPKPPLGRGERQGYATKHGGIAHMPPEAALLVDHLAHGSLYDKVCLAKALLRSTYLGRGKTWTRSATPDSLYEKYLKTHHQLKQWRGLPGTFKHTLGSVFDDSGFVLTDATLLVDTPKVLNAGKRDIYSTGWVALNSILAQKEQQLPTWTVDTFWRQMPKLWCAPFRRLILFHASGCLPTVEALLVGLARDRVPPPTTTEVWKHRDRLDMAWVFDHQFSEDVPE